MSSSNGTHNSITLIGRLGVEPELFYTSKGTAVCHLRLATNRRPRQDEKQGKPDWHRVVIFGKAGETAMAHLSKGRRVLITGELQYRKYEDKDGNDQWITEIVTSSFSFMDYKNGGNGNGNTPAPTNEDVSQDNDSNDQF